jgi:hypothetical protein
MKQKYNDNKTCNTRKNAKKNTLMISHFFWRVRETTTLRTTRYTQQSSNKCSKVT